MTLLNKFKNEQNRQLQIQAQLAGLSTLLVTALRKLGQTNLGAAEIYPSHGKSFSDVFTRKQKGGRGHLIVTYSTFIRPAGTRTHVVMDLSSCILQYCASQDKGGNVTTLPTLLSQLAFTLILQKKTSARNGKGTAQQRWS